MTVQVEKACRRRPRDEYLNLKAGPQCHGTLAACALFEGSTPSQRIVLVLVAVMKFENCAARYKRWLCVRRRIFQKRQVVGLCRPAGAVSTQRHGCLRENTAFTRLLSCFLTFHSLCCSRFTHSSRLQLGQASAGGSFYLTYNSNYFYSLCPLTITIPPPVLLVSTLWFCVSTGERPQPTLLPARL